MGLNLSGWKKKITDILGVAGDAIVPGDQSSWHRGTPTLQQQVSPAVRQVGRAVSRGPAGVIGFGAQKAAGLDKQIIGGLVNRAPQPIKPVATFVNDNIISPQLTSFQRVGGAQAGQSTYAPGMKGVGQIIGDTANIASLGPIGTGVKGANIGIKALKAGALTAPIGIASSVGSDLQAGRPINIKDAALSGAITGATGGAITAGPTLARGAIKGYKNSPTLSSQVGAIKNPGDELAKALGLNETPPKITMRNVEKSAKFIKGDTQTPAERDAVARAIGLKNAGVTVEKPVAAPRIEIKGNPAKDPRVKDILTTLGNARNAAATQESLVASELSSAARKAGVKLDRGFIDRYQAGTLTAADQPVAQAVKRVTDELFTTQQKITPGIQYRKSYVPQSYSQPEQKIVEATRKLAQTTGAEQARAFNSYAEAAQFGLTPRYKTLDQMLGTNARSATSVLGNKEAVDKGLKSGLFDIKAHGGWTPLEGFFSRNGDQIYAQKRVADMFNGVTQKNTTGLGRLFDAGAKISRTTQDIALQGGLPGTSANFFVAGQGIRDTTRNIGTAPLHPIRAIQQQYHLIADWTRSNSRNATQKRFADNADFVKKMADRGVPLQVESSLNDYSTAKGLGAVGAGINKGWNKLGNNPTFGRYLPNRLLSTSQEVFKQARKKMPEAEALDLAAATTKNFAGIVDQVAKGRSTITQNAISTGLFAPRYREAIINSLWNTIKSANPGTWTDKSYQANRQLFTGMAATLIAYDQLNQQINGHGMLQNRKGQELSLQIPYGEKDAKGNQPVMNIPFMPGYTTIPRALFGAVTAGARGDSQGVVAEASKLASMPLQTVGRVIGNEDYFGRPIYKSQKVADAEGGAADSLPTALGKIGAYVAGQNIPAWGRAGINAAQGKPLEQNVATALEAPVRFGKVINPETTAYFENRDNFYKTLDPNERALFDKLNPKKKDSTGGGISPDKTTLTTASQYGDLVANPDFAAKYQRYKQGAKSHDPLWDLPADQLRSYMQAQIISKNDPGGDSTTVRQLYARLPQDFFTKREEYFAGLKSSGANLPETNQKPQMPDNLVKFSADYHNLPYGTGARSAALRSSEGQAYIAYLNQNKIYNNQERADLGLPPLEDSNNSGGGSYARSGGSGGGTKTAGSPYKYSISLNAGGAIRKPKISVKSSGSKKVAAKTSKPKISKKKSLV